VRRFFWARVPKSELIRISARRQQSIINLAQKLIEKLRRMAIADANVSSEPKKPIPFLCATTNFHMDI
jgi:hypothetical protein